MSQINTFVDFKFSPSIIKRLSEIGLRKPTPIQKNCIPAILNGKNCIGCAKTGSGKTLAFALPIIQKLSEEPQAIFALVVTPTRELAFQIADQFEIFGKPMNLRISVIVGGMCMVQQGLALSKHPEIVIATPGRFVDHLEGCNTFSLERVKFLVLDEADRLLGGQFDTQMEKIIEALPKERQTLFFSATFTNTLDQLKGILKNEPFVWTDEENRVATVQSLEQFYLLCHPNARDAYLVQAVRIYRQEHSRDSIMIFTDTCKQCQLLSMMFNAIGFDNVPIHSMIKQRQRLSSLTRFRSRVVRILISTDVAARGLDIPEVGLVINHMPPECSDQYIHRVGRTARAGRPGKAITLIDLSDIKRLHAIEKRIGTQLKIYDKVKDDEISKILLEVSVALRRAKLTLEENNFFEKRKINKRKQLQLEGKDPDEEEEKAENLKKKRRKLLRQKYLENNQKNAENSSEKPLEIPSTEKS